MESLNPYPAFRTALIAVLEFNKSGNEKIANVLCPGFGTGTGMVSATSCAGQMRYAYDSIIGQRYDFPEDLDLAIGREIDIMGGWDE